MSAAARLSLVLALLVGIAVGGSGTTYALWSSLATATATAHAGAVGIAVAGGDTVNVVYGPSVLSRTGTVTVTNTGTVPVTYTTSVATTGSSALVAAVARTSWSVTQPSDCAAAPPGGASTGSLSTMVLSGALTVGAVAYWCVRTTLTAAQVTSLAGAQVVATVTAAASLGQWSASSSTTITQSVATPSYPQMTCVGSAPPWGVSVSWNSPAGWPYHLQELWVDGHFLSAHNANYTSRYLDWATLASATGSTPGNPQVFHLEVRAQNPTTLVWSVIAQGTVVTRIIDYGTYQHQVAQCT